MNILLLTIDQDELNPSVDPKYPVHPIIQDILLLTIDQDGLTPSVDPKHPAHPIILNILLLTIDQDELNPSVDPKYPVHPIIQDILLLTTGSVELIDDKLTYKIIGCAMNVHNTLGSGFQEVIYQRCLAIEMDRAGIHYGREVDQPIYYDGTTVGTRRADFIVADRVIVEIKALTALEDVHIVQVKNYVRVYGFEVGILLNFGAGTLEYKRIYKS